MCNIYVCITNPMRVNKDGYLVGEWVGLPISQNELQEALTKIGITDENSTYFISDSDTENLDIPIDQFTDFTELNELATRIDEVDESDYFKLAALIEWEEPTCLATVHDIIDKMDSYDFLSEIQDDTALGRYYCIDCDILHGTPENMKYFFNFEEFGWSLRCHHNVVYTSLGAIIRN